MKLNIQMFTATAIAKKSITAFNSPVEWSSTAATVDTANGTEEFTFTNVSPRPLVFIKNANATATNKITYEILAGTYPFAQKKTGEVAGGKEVFVELEEGYVEGADGIITIKLTPHTGLKLKTDHVAKVGVLETL